MEVEVKLSRITDLLKSTIALHDARRETLSDPMDQLVESSKSRALGDFLLGLLESQLRAMGGNCDVPA